MAGRELIYRTSARTHVFWYRPDDQDQVIEAAADLARDPERDFSWVDATLVAFVLGAERRREIEAVVDGLARDLRL